MTVRRCLWIGVVMSCVALRLLAADWPELKGDYLDQPLPKASPEVFAPGVISHGFHELGITFSPEGDEIFYITSDRRFQHYVLLHVERRKGRWSEPEPASFAALLSVYSASFGPDGDTLFFTGRPLAGTTGPRAQHDIFRVQKQGGRWGTAVNIGEPINTDAPESSVTVASDGTLYFARDDADGSSDIWVAQWSGDGFNPPARVGSPINTPGEEARPFIAPGQEYLLFQSNREGSLGYMDLYRSVRAEDGSWSEPESLGADVNSAASEFGPSMTPDGRFLFFSAFRGLDTELLQGRGYGELLALFRRPENGYATLYWVAAPKCMAPGPNEMGMTR